MQQINDWLIHNFIFFRGEYQGWKNSVRHNLSLNDCFVKVLRDPSRPWGKDNNWRIASDCNYSFKDGIFRRIKKQKNQKKTNFDFSIDYILSLPSSLESRKSINEQRSISPSDSIGESSNSTMSPPRQIPIFPQNYLSLYAALYRPTYL